jgi:hypothetical protein
LILGLLTLFCGLGSVTLIVPPSKERPILSVVIGLLLLFGCCWVLEKCFRLVMGRKNRGGLMSPTVLRVVAFVLLLLPVCGLFTGYYRQMGAIAVFQVLMYFTGFLGLRALARQREAAEISNAQTKDGTIMEVLAKSEKS